MTLPEIKAQAIALAGRINAPLNLLPTFDSSIVDATPSIEVDRSGLYYYVISERGNEYVRRRTANLNDLNYWIFSAVTSAMATSYGLKNRIEHEDHRRMLFAKQEALLKIISKDWAERVRKEYLSILISHPFDDLAGLRANYCGQLRDRGMSEAEITSLANEKYSES